MELEIDIKCPGCSKEFKQKLRGMKPGAKTKCPHCKETITFKGDDLNKAQKALDNLERAIRGLNKTIEIKL